MLGTISKMLFTVLMLLGTSFSHGSVYHDVARRIPKMLIEKGFSRIGSLDLNKLVQEMGTLRFSQFSDGFLLGSGCRSGAVNFRREGFIAINSLAVSQTTNLDQIRVLFTHEALEALGYEDNNYELSVVMYLLWKKANSESDLPKQLLHPFYSLTRHSDNRRFQLAGGGISGVGGGGDGYTLIEKAETLWLLFSSQEFVKKYGSPVVEKTINFVIQSRFEDFYSCRQDEKLRISAPETHPRECFELVRNQSKSVFFLLQPCFEPTIHSQNTIESVRRELLVEAIRSR